MSSQLIEQNTNYQTRSQLPLHIKAHNKQILLSQQYDKNVNNQDQNQKTIGFNNVNINNINNNNSNLNTNKYKLPKKIKAQTIDQNQNDYDQDVTLKSGMKKKNKQKEQLLEIEQETQWKNKQKQKNINKNKIFKLNLTESIIKESLHDQQKSNIKNNYNEKPKLIQPIPSAQISNKISQIISAPSLRQKFSSLLPGIHQRPLSYQHHQLLKIMSIIDQSIQFSSQTRSIKSVFFQDIRKRIRDSLRIFIRMDHIEQLLFLDQKLYDIKWEYSMNKKGYDLKIQLPKIQSKDQRKNHIRTVIINYINEKHQQFIKQKRIYNYNNRYATNWHTDFQLSSIIIPKKNLPVHPQIKQASLRCFDDSKIKNIKNNNLKQLITDHKQKSQISSFKSKSILDMMFTKKLSPKDYEDTLIKAIKQKQQNKKLQILQQEQYKYKQKQQIQPEILKDLAQNILFIYISKSVTNIFKVKLIEMLTQRINSKHSNTIINRHVEYLISLKNIGFLKQIVPSQNKPIILQINKNKIKQIQQHADKLNIKQEKEGDI